MCAINLRKFFTLGATTSKEISTEEDLVLRDQMRVIQEQRERSTRNFGNAGGLNSPTDFNRGVGGRAVDDHLNRSPKDNP